MARCEIWDPTWMQPGGNTWGTAGRDRTPLFPLGFHQQPSLQPEELNCCAEIRLRHGRGGTKVWGTRRNLGDCARPCMGAKSAWVLLEQWDTAWAMSHSPIPLHTLPCSSCPHYSWPAAQEEFHCGFGPVGRKYPITLTSLFWGS